MKSGPRSEEMVLYSRQRGFTLLEVLLAGFILFMVLSSMTLVYRGALLSSEKASRALSIAAALPMIRVIVTQQLKKG